MTEHKPTEDGTQRLLRIGTLTLTVLGPVINTIGIRLADRLERGKKPKIGDVKTAQNKPRTKETILTDKDKEILVTKPSLSGALQGGRDALLEELEELVERSAKLSQALTIRGSEVTRDLTERGNRAAQELAKRNAEIRKELRKRGQKLNRSSQKVVKRLSKRGERVAKQLSTRSERVAKQLSARSRQATQQFSKRTGTFWVIFGFSVGLTAAGIAAYLLIKQRIRHQEQLEEEQSLQLAQNGYLNANAPSSQRPSRAALPGSASQAPARSSATKENTPAIAVAEQDVNAAQSIPADTAFVGVIDTKRYYPFSTPLDQLVAAKTEKADVIYFNSVEDAQKQGYSSGV